MLAVAWVIVGVAMLAIAARNFGLSTPNASTEAVATGIKATAGTITNAALIMVAVALTFALAHDIGIKQFGFGLAIAIFLDATVIRSILLPASMELLGERNWYLPGWLGWLPHISMSE